MAVLDGSQPLTRSVNSGGLEFSMMNMSKVYEARRFGEQANITTIGKKHLKAEEFFSEQTEAISDPLTNLNTSFNDYFKFMKDNRKEDMKVQGRHGLMGMFKEYFSFKVWKKVFGIARDPQVAALHQIRDLLVEVYQPKNKEKYLIDPEDAFTAIFKVFPKLNKKFGSGEGGIGGSLKNIPAVIKGIFLEIKEDTTKFDNARFKQMGLGGDNDDAEMKKQMEDIAENKSLSVGKYIKKSLGMLKNRGALEGPQTEEESKENISKTAEYTYNMVGILEETKDVTKTMSEKFTDGVKKTNTSLSNMITQSAERAEKEDYMNSNKKGGNNKMDKVGLSIWKWLGIAGIVLALFGKKGAIALGAIAFFTQILPLLFTKLLPILLFKVLPKLLMSAPGLAVFGGLMAHDYFNGGKQDFERKDKNGKSDPDKLMGTLHTLFGKANLASTSNTIGNIGKQMIKWGAAGLVLGGPIGAAIGLVIGGLGGSITTLIDIQKFKTALKGGEDWAVLQQKEVDDKEAEKQRIKDAEEAKKQEAKQIEEQNKAISEKRERLKKQAEIKLLSSTDLGYGVDIPQEIINNIANAPKNKRLGDQSGLYFESVDLMKNKAAIVKALKDSPLIDTMDPEGYSKLAGKIVGDIIVRGGAVAGVGSLIEDKYTEGDMARITRNNLGISSTSDYATRAQDMIMKLQQEKDRIDEENKLIEVKKTEDKSFKNKVVEGVQKVASGIEKLLPEIVLTYDGNTVFSTASKHVAAAR